jgi:hypothetical protein
MEMQPLGQAFAQEVQPEHKIGSQRRIMGVTFKSFAMCCRGKWLKLDDMTIIGISRWGVKAKRKEERAWLKHALATKILTITRKVTILYESGYVLKKRNCAICDYDQKEMLS